MKGWRRRRKRKERRRREGKERRRRREGKAQGKRKAAKAGRRRRKIKIWRKGWDLPPLLFLLIKKIIIIASLSVTCRKETPNTSQVQGLESNTNKHGFL